MLTVRALATALTLTVVATGFGGRGRRPRGDFAPPAEQRRPPGEGGDLDVPSFLKT